jgi:hypothetical protein
MIDSGNAQPQGAHHGHHHSDRVKVPAHNQAQLQATTLQPQNRDDPFDQIDWVRTGLLCITLMAVLVLFVRFRNRRSRYAPPPQVRLPIVASAQPGTLQSQQVEVLDWMASIELVLGRYCSNPGEGVAEWIRTARSFGLDNSFARSMQRINYQRNRLVHDRVQLSEIEWHELQQHWTYLFGPR